MTYTKPIMFGLMFVLMLSACGPAAPTVDPYLVYTQAAETVAVQLSQTAAAMPTATETPLPTETPIPVTDTPALPSETPTALFTLPPQPTAPLVAATATSAQKAGDHATLGSQVPADGTRYKPGQEFQVMFSFINDGATTWKPEYRLVFLGGTQISTTKSVECGRTVKPGEKCEFYFNAVAPPGTGKFQSNWKVVNADNKYIGECYLQIIVE
ncbi:MAG: hypothetical protein HPY76_07975 [Anaerolineae bacterium]|nr:hypothetical protein [Anaerolineae bacterium]